jgi:DNA-binding CsgD family transcriptional regulator
MRELILNSWDIASRSIAAVATEGAGSADVDRFAAMLRAASSPATLVALQDAAIVHDPRLPETYQNVRVPTLILHREGDSLVPPASALEIATSIPGARLELLDGEPHVHFVGDVVALAHHITTFLAGGPGTSSAQVSPREAEVLDLVASGCSNTEVAQRLTLSVRTVERHLLNAYAKLGAHSRAEATARWVAARNGSSSALRSST